MASRVAEVIYRLKDLFTGPAERVSGGYDRIRRSSRGAADSVERDNTRMGSSFGRLSAAVKAAGVAFAAAFAGRQIVGGISEVADELDRLGKTSRRLDIDPQTLAGLEFAADRSGIAISKMSASIETLQKRTGEALNGIGRAKIAFDSLGISAQEFADLNADKQLVQIANALQGVASEEERAAIAAQLFSKANADLLNLLNEGGPAIAEYLEEFGKFRQITVEQTEAAEAYNDALTNLGAAVDGIKFKSFTPVIEALNKRMNELGLGANEIKNLEAQLNLARAEFDELAAAGEQSSKAFNEVSLRVVVLSQQLDDLKDAQEAAQEAAKADAEARAEQAASMAAYQQQVGSVAEVYETQTKAQQASLKQQTAELNAARSEQASIEKEFANLVQEITAPDIDDVDLGDIFGKVNEAAAAASRGQSDLAVETAREGATLLKQLKEEGTETDGTLRYLAERLQAVAKEAAGQNVKLELVDVKNAQTALDKIRNEADVLATDFIQKGSDAARAYIQGMNQTFAEAAIVPPTVPAPADVASTKAPSRIIRNGNNFSDGLNYRENEKRGGK